MNSQEMLSLRAQKNATEGVKAGFKAAAIAGIATAIPTLMGARRMAWGRANLNHAAQTLIICTASGAAFFVAADKAILNSARSHAFQMQMNNELKMHPELPSRDLLSCTKNEESLCDFFSP